MFDLLFVSFHYSICKGNINHDSLIPVLYFLLSSIFAKEKNFITKEWEFQNLSLDFTIWVNNFSLYAVSKIVDMQSLTFYVFYTQNFFLKNISIERKYQTVCFLKITWNWKILIAFSLWYKPLLK